MLNMRESWTDERLDDFAKHVDHRFDEVDRRFEKVDRRFDDVNRRFDKVDSELHRVNDRLNGLHRAMIFAMIALTMGILAGFAALTTAIAQLA
jgi:tetrahydromethanopterin S-methyltransferase subunit G